MNKEDLNYKLDLEDQSIWLFVSANLEIKNSLPFVQELGNFYAHEEYFTQRKGLASYYISYTVSGSAILDYKNEKNLIQPFQVFWVDCRNYQKYYPQPPEGKWNQLWVHFYGPSCDSYYKTFLKQNNNSNVVTLPAENQVPSKIEQLIGMYKHGNNSFAEDVFATSILVDIMTQCILAASTTTDLTAMPDFIRDSVIYIRDNYKKKITLDHLSQKYSIDKYYFQKTFKKHLGITPNSYLITTRLNKAKELLRTTTLPVNQVATAVGMENVSHFINTFKKHENTTPLEYGNTWYWKKTD